MNVADLTLFDYTSDQLRNLCAEAGFEETDNTPVEMLGELLGPAGRRPLSDGPQWPSDVADDATPVEFSVALDDSGDRAVRVLGETIAERPSPIANVEAARRFLDVMKQRIGIATERFDALEDLFLPEQPQGKFAFWYSLIFRPSSPPKLKVYFNPAVRGADRSHELVAEGFRRLGLHDAYDIAMHHAMVRGDSDQFSFFAVDLDDDPLSRVKLYISHQDGTSDDAERAAKAVGGVDPVQVKEFCELLGGTTGPFTGRPLVSSYSFVEAAADGPGNYSLYLPIRSYVPDDEVARERVLSFLDRRGVAQANLDRAIRAVSRRPLRDGVGLLAHVSLRLGQFGTGTTIYLSSEGYDVLPPRAGAHPVGSVARV